MDNLRKMREGIGLSQQKLADRIGPPLTQQKLHAYETGAYEPDIAMLKTLANFFETTIDYLVGNTEIFRKPEPVKEYDLNGEEQKLVNRYRNLRPKQRQSLALFLDTLEDRPE